MLQEDVLALRGDVSAALAQLEGARREGAGVVASLELVDAVKARMEAACTTLKVRAGAHSSRVAGPGTHQFR